MWIDVCGIVERFLYVIRYTASLRIVLYYNMFKRVCLNIIWLCHIVNFCWLLRFQAEVFFVFRESALYQLFRDPLCKVNLNYENVRHGQGWGQWVPIPPNLRFCLATPSRHKPPDRNVFVFSIPLFLLCDISRTSPHTSLV